MEKNKQISLIAHQTKPRREMTCIVGGKCKDGIVIISDRKTTYKDHPTDYREKIHKLGGHPIITAGAGGSTVYNNFRMKLIPELNSQTDVWNSAQVSGITIQMYGTSGDDFALCQTRIENTVKQVNAGEPDNTRIELLVATQIASHDTMFTHINISGYSTDEPYKAIGTGGRYAYVFIKPFYNDSIQMEEFARIGYFTIKYLDKFELDPDVGLDKNNPRHAFPQIWFVPNIGSFYSLEDKPDLLERFEADTNKMLDNFKKRGINALLAPDG